MVKSASKKPKKKKALSADEIRASKLRREHKAFARLIFRSTGFRRRECGGEGFFIKV
jgi:hypothetical protein